MTKNIRLYAAPYPGRLQSENGDTPLPYHDCRDSRVQGDEAARHIFVLCCPEEPMRPILAFWMTTPNSSRLSVLPLYASLCPHMHTPFRPGSIPLHPESWRPSPKAGTLFEQFSVYTLYSKHEGVRA